MASQSSIVSIAYGLWGGRSGVRILAEARDISFCPKCPDWLWRQPHIEEYRGSIPDIWHVGHEINHSPPSTAEAQNEWFYTSAPPVCLLVWTRQLLHFLHITVRELMTD